MRTVALVSAAVTLMAFPVAETVPLPERLSDTGLYRMDRPSEIDPANRFFSPQYPLWTDGMTKRRWIYLPPGTSIDGRDEFDWNFPVGTKLWKEFSVNGRKVETRLLWKVSEDRWEFAAYAWNAEGTDAIIAPDGVPGAADVAPGRRHTIPSRTDCAACHGTRKTGPLGFNALQLSTDRDPNAIHGEPLRDGMVTIRTLVESDLLMHSRADLLARPPRITASAPSTRTVLGYFAANCGACHNGNGEIAALGPVIRLREIVADGDAVARTLVGYRTKWQVPGVPDGRSVLIDGKTPDLSAILVRMRSRSPSSQMPPLGTVVRDQEAVDALTQWIAAGLARSH